MAKDQKILSFQKTILAVGVLLMIIKFIAFYFTGSNAILSDSLESIVNVLTGGFALYSLYLAQQPRDLNHPYGHGKIEFISASIEGTLIIIAGLMIIGKSVYNLFVPQELNDLTIGIWLTVIAGTVNGIMGKISELKGKQIQSPTLVAAGRHLFSDFLSSIGLVLGLLLIYFTKIYWIDSAIAIVFGLIIIFSGYKVIRHSVGGLMDEADEDVLESIVNTLDKNRRDKWIDVHNLRTQRFGHLVHVDAHVTLPYYLTLKESHEELKIMDDLISRQFRETEFFIHADPCIPTSCPVCRISDCPVRHAPYQGTVIWKVQDTLKNRKHTVKDLD
ncbi:cation diffusion facilitator family transporter [Mangrovivirga cuniculi]|uniref:Cation diffusion facilitator family transporter n=1 Tax=Mangrovivirga cuniculi TaxID=2715131 RepID=A0A4D7JNQ0_9BACT|nr:cation diffusion facilitator family transporter [Mangrovivirga cuniculi]QCK16297.1 cation diffusion facilitator family transporter [Mangrovivirga cuniculi]